jgi:hypothetical protein
VRVTKAQLQLKNPNSDEDTQRLLGEVDTYTAAVGYVASFVENRAVMGDMTTKEVLVEFNENVIRMMKGGFEGDEH